jgi:hypothetical protein
MSVIIKFLESESVSKVLHFFNTAQSDKLMSNKRTREEFDWLFINSYFKSSLYAVAWDSDSEEIIGTYAAIFIPFLSKTGESILSLKGEDSVISLDKMIGLGKRDLLKELLNTLIEKSKDEDAKFMWGFTPARAAFQRTGFKIITQIRGSFYVINPLKFYKNRIKLFPQLTFNKKIQLYGFSWYNSLNIKFKFVLSGHFSLKKISLDEVDEGVFLSFLPQNVYTIYLSKKFLKWRIKENPSAITYGFLEFSDKKDIIVAYFIFSSNKENIFFIEQFLFARELTDSKKVQIMKLALNYCRKQKAIMVRALGFSHNIVNINEMKLLSKIGFHFFLNPEESYFVFQNISDFEIKPEDIYLSRLNTQGIR